MSVGCVLDVMAKRRIPCKRCQSARVVSFVEMPPDSCGTQTEWLAYWDSAGIDLSVAGET